MTVAARSCRTRTSSLRPRPRRRVDRAERADRAAAGSGERNAEVGDDPELADRGAVPHERVGAGVLDHAAAAATGSRAGRRSGRAGSPACEPHGCFGPTQLAKWSWSSSTTVISATGTSSSEAASRVARSNSSRAAASYRCVERGRRVAPVRTPCGGRGCAMAELLPENTLARLSSGDVPEGDALHRAALRLQPLVGQRLEVESPNPRAQATQVAPRVDGRVLESVEAVGKNLLLRFEGGLVVRSHLRMTGRWRIEPRGKARTRAAVARAPRRDARGRALERAGADARDAESPAARPGRARGRSSTSTAAVARLRGAGDLWLGEALQDQRLVAGIGNMWMAEALWSIRVSPWVRVRDVDDDVLARRRRARPGG